MAPISLKKGRIDEITADLVTSITGIEKGTDNFKLSLEFAVSNFRFHRFLDVNSFEVKRKLDGISEKFLIHCQHEKALKLNELKEKFLSSPLTATQFSQNTEEHFGVLSLLLNLSDSPILSDYIPKREKKAAIEDEVNWTEYLLDGEEKLQTGIYLTNEQLSALEESDQEETTIALPAREDNQEQHVLQKNISRISDQFLEVKQHQSDLTWLQENTVAQYWNGKSTAYVPQIESGYDEDQNADESYASQLILHSLETASHNNQFVHKLTEKIIIRETLWMLQGMESTFVYVSINNQYAVRTGVTMGHTSQASLQKMLESFATAGTHLHTLKQYAAEACDIGKSNLRTLRAFGYSISCFLRKVRKTLSEIETEVVKATRVYTCLRLAEAIKEMTKNAKLVFNLFNECVTSAKDVMSPGEFMAHIIDTLYDAVCRFDSHGGSGVGQLIVVLPIFLETIRPFLSDLGNWVAFGKLPVTSNGEFFIEKTLNDLQYDSDVWYNAFRINSRDQNGKSKALVPKFLIHDVEKILLVGKSCGLLEQAIYNSTGNLSSSFDEEFLGQFFDNLGISSCLDGVDIKTVGIVSKEIKESILAKGQYNLLLVENFVSIFWTKYEKICNVYNVSISDATNSLHSVVQQSVPEFTSQAACRLPIKLIFEKTLKELVDVRYTHASNSLINMLKIRYKLDEHLTVMRDFFFMEAGDVMNMFYSEVFTKIRNREIWRNTSYLTSALHESLFVRFPHLVAKLTVGVKSSADSRKSAKSGENIQLIDGVYLHYQMEWPLTIFFDSKIEEKYNAVFGFLFQVKRALWLLEQLRFTDLNVEQIEANRPLIQLRHKLYILRARLLHFVQSFHVYIMTRILHSSGLEFKERLGNAKDFEEVLTGHKDFLDKVYDRCLLSPKVGFAKEAITRILSLCLNFQTQWDKGLSRIVDGDIASIATEFDKCSHFIQSFLNSLIKRGSFPHLELLSLSLRS